ncbi:MAG: DUF167 domain-containing protein [Armatimonadetes bacterium]|nr:DUF167 domain-containing protein [Armatimonadota bacterium]
MVVLLRVIPRSQPEGLAGLRDGRLLVRLSAAPVDGAANKALTAVLAQAFGVSRSRVDLQRGEKSREKEVLLRGLAMETVLAALPPACCT